MCPPEMFIVAETMIAMPTPCARAMPRGPGTPAVAVFMTMVPPPTKTNSSVPMASAASERMREGMQANLPAATHAATPERR